MDHKVSKDMISSGMIPSGEKTQADLGKTQYGSAPSPSKLMDAYKSMYDKKEEVINEMAGKGMGMTPAPKPQGITPAKRVEKSNLPAKRVEKSNLPKPQDPATSKPQKDFIKARMSDSPAPKTETKPETKSMVDTVRDRRKEVVSARREKVQGIMNKYGESVDLLAAYRAVYEHHKKDADGNTIPHEDEEVNEGKIPAGLQAYLDKKKGKKEDKKEVKEFVEKVKGMPPTNEMGKVMVGQEAKDYYKAQKSKRKPFEPVKPKRKPFEPVAEENQDLHEVLPLIAKAGAMLGKIGAGAAKAGAAAGKTGAMASKVASGAAKVTASGGKVLQGGGPTSLLGKAKKFVKDNPLTSYSIARDMTSGGGGSAAGQTKTSSISASADLFDIVKGQLLDEGLTEEEIRDIMLTLTPDEIMSEMAVNPNIAAMDAKNKADMIARAKAKEVPQNIRDASKRQMKAGTPREDPKNPYTTQDKKDIINYNKNK